jgi:hypothetical protein
MRMFKRGASRDSITHPCPRCGARVADAFGLVCPGCGWDLRDVYRRASGAVTGCAPARSGHAPASARVPVASASLALRVRVWWHASALDARLAHGLPPTISPALTLRAQQLASDNTRRALSRALTEVVDGAARSRTPRTATAPVDAAGVLEAAGPLVSLARELRRTSDPAVRGVALASVLVCDGITSPLYNRRSPVTVRDVAQQARAALAAP